MYSTRILVVDPDAASRASLHQILANFGYHVRSAEQLDSARQVEGEFHPQLAFVDVGSGPSQGSHVDIGRCLNVNSDLPLIFIGERNDANLINQCMAVGGLAYLCKPLAAHQLPALIQASQILANKLRQLKSTSNQLESALTGDRETSVAVGLLMERFRLELHDAFEILRNRARNERRRIHDLAAEMVAATNTLNRAYDVISPNHPALRADPSKPRDK